MIGGGQYGGYVAPVHKYEFGKLTNIVNANVSLLKTELAKNNKSLDAGSEEAINKVIADFTKTEEKLGKVISALNTYAKLIDTFGPENDKNQVLTVKLMDDFNKSKESLVNKLDKKNITIKDLLIQLSNQI
jgi:hypothetical protein